MCVPHVSDVHKGQTSWSLQDHHVGSSLPRQCWELHPGPLQEHQLLSTTETSLQTHAAAFEGQLLSKEDTALLSGAYFYIIENFKLWVLIVYPPQVQNNVAIYQYNTK